MVQKRFYLLLTALFLLVGMAVNVEAFAGNTQMQSILADDIGDGETGDGESEEDTYSYANTYYERGDATTLIHLTNRRALVGLGCEVNKNVKLVGLGTWENNPSYITDDDLTNSTSFNDIVKVGLGYTPVTSVRDMRRVYKKGTIAGYKLIKPEGDVLGLEVIGNMFVLQFCLNGEVVGTIVPKDNGSGALVKLSLLSIPGANEIEISGEAPEDFDEVCLALATGVELKVADGIKVKYAFVGKSKEYTITSNAENGMGTYPGGGYNLHHAGTGIGDANLTDGDLSNAATTVELKTGLVNLGFGGTFKAYVSYPILSGTHSAPFKAGTLVGFKTTGFNTLTVGIKGVELSLLDENGTKISGKTEEMSGGVAVGAVSVGDDAFMMVADVDFYGVELNITGVEASVIGSGTLVNYAFVRMPTEVEEKHDLKIEKEEDPCTDFYKIASSDESIHLTYNLIKWPDGGEGKAAVGDNGIVTFAVGSPQGKYVFQVSDGHPSCAETVSIYYGNISDTDLYEENSALVNKDDKSSIKYIISGDTHKISGALLRIFEKMDDKENIVNETFKDYAQYTGGAAVIDNELIVGVKAVNKSDNTPTIVGENINRIGFVVEMQTTGLGVNLLNMFNIRAYDIAGNEIVRGVVEDFDVLSADLIGSSAMQKVRLSIPVEDLSNISEIQLWKSGVLSLQLTRLNVYYAFADVNNVPFDHMKGVEVISYKDGATLKTKRAGSAGIEAASVINVSDDLTYIIDDDDDLETCVKISNTLGSGQASVINVNLGRTYSNEYQVGVIIENNTYLASVDVGSWIKIKTLKNGVFTQKTTSNWNVVGANVIGNKDKNLLYIQPEEEFDEIQVEFNSVVELLDNIKVYGVFVRHDTDHDGIPDAVDEAPCRSGRLGDKDELLLKEGWDELLKNKKYNDALLVLNRKFSRGNITGYEYNPETGLDDKPVLDNKNLWNSLVLPVSLTGLQLRNAFGNFVRIAKAAGLNQNDPNIIRFELINVPNNNESAVVEPGKFYIIKTLRPPFYDIDETDPEDFYETSDLAEKNKYPENHIVTGGEVYLIDGVSYSSDYDRGEPSERFSPAEGLSHNDIIFKGGYAVSAFPSKSYAFSNGNMYRTSMDGRMKGFRFWIQDDEAVSARNFTFTVEEDGIINGIFHVVNDGEVLEGDDYIYDISGRRIGCGDKFNALKSGLYIIKGKKILVKR